VPTGLEESHQPATAPCGDRLTAWAERSGRRHPSNPSQGDLRFAFYGRISTEDWQDPVTSWVRQRDRAAALVAGHGTIVTEFFDAGESRTLAWARRPQPWSPRWLIRTAAGMRS
jgi:site-specific DNA recombinase